MAFTPILDLPPLTVDVPRATWLGAAPMAAVENAVATVVALGGGTVQLPAGDAALEKIGTLPKNLGNTFLRIRGQGERLTELSLSGGRRRVFDLAATVAGQDAFENITLEDFSVDQGNQVSPSGDHTLIGLLQGGALRERVTCRRLKVQRVTFRNMAEPTGTNQQGNRAIMFSTWFPDTGLSSHVMQDITVQDITADGGSYVVGVMAQSPGVPVDCFHDNIVIRRIRKTSPRVPTVFSFSCVVHVCSVGWGRTCVVEDIYGEGVDDVAVEVDNMTDVRVRNVRGVDCYNNVLLLANFVAAGNSAPVVTKLTADAALNATVLAVGATAGITAGDYVCVNGLEVRKVQSVDSGVQLTLATGLTGARTSGTWLYRVGDINNQTMRAEGISSRRTAAANGNPFNLVLLQNVNVANPMGHVVLRDLKVERTGDATAVVGDVVKIQAARGGAPRSVVVDQARAVYDLTNASGADRKQIAFSVGITNDDFRGSLKLRDIDVIYKARGTSAGSSTHLMLYEQFESNMDLDINGLGVDVDVASAGAAASSQLGDIGAGNLGSTSVRVRGVHVRSWSDETTTPLGFRVRRSSGYAHPTVRKALGTAAVVGDTTLLMPDTTGLFAGQKVCVGAKDISVSELHTIASVVANTSITVVAHGSGSGMKNAHAIGALVAPMLPVLYEDCDFTQMPSGAFPVLYIDQPTMAAVKISKCTYPKPVAPVVITPAASATPFQIVDGHEDGVVAINGGTGTLVETSVDGANWYQHINQASGTFNATVRLKSGEFCRVTYTVVPNVRRVVNVV